MAEVHLPYQDIQNPPLSGSILVSPFRIWLMSQSPIFLFVDKLLAISLEHILFLSGAFAYAVPSFFLECSSFSWPVPWSCLPPAHAGSKPSWGTQCQQHLFSELCLLFLIEGKSMSSDIFTALCGPLLQPLSFLILNYFYLFIY